MVEDRSQTLVGNEPEFVPLQGFQEYPEDEMAKRAADFYAEMASRRTVRQFSDRPVPRAVIEDCLKVLGPPEFGRIAGAVLKRISDEDPVRAHIAYSRGLKPYL